MIMLIAGLLIIGYVFGVALAPDDTEYDRDQRERNRQERIERFRRNLPVDREPR
jgi:hypothetical protein